MARILLAKSLKHRLEACQSLRVAEHPLRRCPYTFGRRFCTTATAEAGTNRPSTATLVRHFVTCAVPMFGFGVMDNSILIRAGDAIDNSLGDMLGLTGLECAACGQVLSDFCGVCFGGVIESISRRFILPPTLSPSQAVMRLTQVVGTAGAAIGVVCGCIAGMTNLLFMDLKEAERQKKLLELQERFKLTVTAAAKAFKCEFVTVFIVDEENDEMWSFAPTSKGEETVFIRTPRTESLVGWAALNNKILHIPDAYDDPRFNRSVDKTTGKRTKQVLSVPVERQGEPGKVIAVLQLMNKDPDFGEVDIRMAEMLAEHTSIFLSEFIE